MRKDSQLAIALMLMLFVAASLSSARAGETVAVRLELLSAPVLQLQLGEVVDAPIRVRVLRQSDSQPLEGVAVDFFSDLLFCIPLDPNCNEPDPLMYGVFLSSPDEPPGSGRSLSNAEGIAVSPDFEAGSVAGSYQIAIGVYTHAGQNFSSLGSIAPSVAVVQGSGGGAPGTAATVPSSGWQAQALLVALLLVFGGLLLRRSQA
jgi:hypothetical protein